jgi:hypothetical protein
MAVYTATIQVGSKSFTVLVDTLSPNFFLPGVDCMTGGCAGRQTIGPADSTTLVVTNNTWSIEWDWLYNGSGNASGVFVQDAVILAGLTVPMSFGAATTMDIGLTDGVLPATAFSCFSYLMDIWG